MESHPSDGKNVNFLFGRWIALFSHKGPLNKLLLQNGTSVPCRVLFFLFSYHLLTFHWWPIFYPLVGEESSFFGRHFTASLLTSFQKITCCYSYTVLYYSLLNVSTYNLSYFNSYFHEWKPGSQSHREYMVTQYRRPELRSMTLNLFPLLSLLRQEVYIYTHCKRKISQIIHEKAEQFLLLPWKNQAIWLPSWHIWIRISGWKFRSKQTKRKELDKSRLKYLMSDCFWICPKIYGCTFLNCIGNI